MNRRRRPARELITDLGALAADLREHSEADIADAVAFLHQLNPDLCTWLATILTAPPKDPQ